MAQHISEIMTAEPVTVTPQTSIADVSQMMREEDIGEVLVAEDGTLEGVVTDRDLVVRAMAEARDPQQTHADEVCSHDIVTCPPSAEIGEAARLMRERAVRRLPVVDEGQLVGTVSIGDLALDRDRESALADISAAEPNR